MFSFFQTIFHKVTIAVASIAVAVGLISTPVPQTPAIINPTSDAPVVSQQETAKTIQQAQPIEKVKTDTKTIDNSAELEKAKQEAEVQRIAKERAEAKLKAIQDQQVAQAVTQVQPQTQQPPRTVPPRPEKSDDWIFNWDAWAWEKHPSAPPITPTINLPQPNQNVISNQRVQYENTLRIQEQNRNDQINTLLAEYNQKINDIDMQIIAIKDKYYKDVEAAKQTPGVSTGIMNGKIARLTDDANWEIQKLQNQEELLRLQYLNKINSVQ